MDHLLPTAKGTTTLNSFTKKNKITQFTCEKIQYTQYEKRLLLGAAVSVAVYQVMDNHYFKIGGSIHKQSDGGSIGMDLTVELASIYMLLWDEKFKKKCSKLGLQLDLFKRYVDDSLQVAGGIVTGWEYCKDSDRLVYKTVGVYDELPVDQRTFSILRDIANEVDPCIKMELDVRIHVRCPHS